MKCNYWWVWLHHLFTFYKLHSTLGIKFSKTGFLQLVDSGSRALNLNCSLCVKDYHTTQARWTWWN